MKRVLTGHWSWINSKNSNRANGYRNLIFTFKDEESKKESEIYFRYQDFICFGISSDPFTLPDDTPVTRPHLYSILKSSNYSHFIKHDASVKSDGGVDDCDQAELRIITKNGKEVQKLQKAFDKFNMLNPDDEEEESEGEMFTKEYFDRLESDKWVVISQ